MEEITFGLTLAGAFLGAATLWVAVWVLLLERRAASDKKAAADVWVLFDACYTTGYTLIASSPSQEDALKWIDRVANFCRVALGFHAMQLVLQDVRNFDPQELQSFPPERVIMLAMTRMHEHIADKIVDGRVRPDFECDRWLNWTPDEPVRE